MKTRRWLFPSLLREQRVEFLDEPHKFIPELRGNLRDMRRLNRWFGGVSPVLRYIDELVPRGAEVRLLDVATGSGDIPLALYKWAISHEINAHVVGLDVSPEILNEAKNTVGDAPVQLTLGDALRLPFPDGSFDVVTCNLALHHFAPEEARRALREMWRVTREWILITDLRRSYLAYVAAWLATRTIARNRLTRHDGPLSVLRAYTGEEVKSLALDCGIEPLHVRKHAFFRQALLANKRVVACQ